MLMTQTTAAQYTNADLQSVDPQLQPNTLNSISLSSSLLHAAELSIKQRNMISFMLDSVPTAYHMCAYYALGMSMTDIAKLTRLPMPKVIKYLEMLPLLPISHADLAESIADLIISGVLSTKTRQNLGRACHKDILDFSDPTLQANTDEFHILRSTLVDDLMYVPLHRVLASIDISNKQDTNLLFNHALTKSLVAYHNKALQRLQLLSTDLEHFLESTTVQTRTTEELLTLIIQNV